MKTKILMLLALFFAITTVTKAQQGTQRRTVEERVKSAMDKLVTPLTLDQAEQDKTTVVFTDYYTARNKMREDARASGNRPDRNVFEKMTNDRDEKLKAIFTDEQYKKFKEELAPTLRLQRQQDSDMQSSGS
jgi:hypothetical protein